METAADPLYEAALEAVRTNRWGDASRLLSELDVAGDLSPDGLELLADVAWWERRLDDALTARERATAAYVAAGRIVDAARVAVAAASENLNHGQPAVARGWQSRAERLLANEPESIAHGHLERLRSYVAFERDGDLDRGLAHADEALRIARAFGDVSLELVAAQDHARILVAGGNVEEGLASLDEVMATALTGDVGVRARGVAYCNMIRTCDQLADYGRANEWTDAARRWCSTEEVTVFPGVCRVFRASLLRMRGLLDEAEREAREAFDELEPIALASALPGLVEIGVILVTVGDLDGAEDIFSRAEQLGATPLLGRAQLALARDDARSAYTELHEALSEPAPELHRAELLPTYVTAACATRHEAEADRAAAELTRIAERFGTLALRGRAAVARGSVALLAGNLDDAERALRTGARQLREAGSVLEAAEARIMLGRTLLASGSVDDGRRVIEESATVLERHGARPAADRARALLTSHAERRVRSRRTFVFTDIVSSTELVAAVGDDAWRDLVAWHDRALRDCVRAHDGEEVKTLGDGFFLAFPAPDSGLGCAISMQRKLAAHRREHGFAPRIRIGIHAADADEAAGDYRGRGVNEAARIGAVAGADEILASSSTLEEAGDGFRASEPRTISLKGIPDPVAVVVVDWS